MQITIDRFAARTVLAALAAVTRSGGGSFEHSLLQDLQDQVGEQADLELTCQYQRTAHNEFVEGGGTSKED